MANELVAVGPGLPSSMLLLGRLEPRPVNPLPVQPVKIHRPLLRPDTLSRERLNGWLDRAARGRLALVIGEAGFGKTTFLADWAGLTSRRTAWYRLESDDRDWLTFIRHLVASGRELDPAFASGTYRMLMSLGPGGPTPADITQALAREMAEFGAADPRGFSLIFDDYQVVESNHETDPIMRALIEATGPGFSLVIAARTSPQLPVGRLRSRSAIARLDGDELRFDVPETDRLFRDAYRIPLDPDVVTELVARTEGWAALLSLVRTNLEERADPDPRALVAQLSATRGDLYDFLAEEVLVDLPPNLQAFLTRVSILESIDPATASLVDTRSSEELAASIAQGESLGLLMRPDRGLSHRFHPLVRDFLVARLEASIGSAAIRELHASIARALEATDWYSSAMHFRSAGEPGAAARVVDGAIPSIVGSGQFERALPFLDGTAGAADRVGALVLRSRIEFARGNWHRAVALAEAAAAVPGNPLLGTALLNLSALEGVAGFPDGAITRAATALDTQLSEPERRVAQASLLLQSAQNEGSLAEVAEALRQLAIEQEFAGLRRYAAISRLNLASVLIWLGDPRAALDEAVRAEVGLGDSPADVERVAALSARATALAQLRRDEEAALVMRHALSVRSLLGRQEAAIEVARTECDYGSVDRATEAILKVERGSLPAGYRGLFDLVSGLLALRSGAGDRALAACELTRAGELRDAAGALRTRLLRARTALLQGDPSANETICELARIATAQESRPGQLIAHVLSAVAETSQITTAVTALGPDDRHILSVVAEDVARVLSRLSPQALSVVTDEAVARPERWASALRLVVAHPGPSRHSCAVLLATIGAEQDAAYLRELAAATKGLRPAAAAITRRLAPSVFLADLGAVRIEIAGSATNRTTRRKVLGLLCFLASRTGQAATKDEALDALWPEVSPDTGSNSLHQAIYYLRRVFDPDFREGVSAPYVEFDGDVISLNPGLFDSASKRCWRLLTGSPAHDLAATDELLRLYVGRYALDFAYEEWAAGYRETLHAAVLGRAEASMGVALGQGDFDWAVSAGQRALFVDPAADGIELQLLRAYKASGRLAAASEQYAHYSTTLRDDLGVDPPPFDAI